MLDLWQRQAVNELLLVYQAAQQVMELQEAAQINQGLQTANVGRDTSVHDMKAIVKTWRCVHVHCRIKSDAGSRRKFDGLLFNR